MDADAQGRLHLVVLFIEALPKDCGIGSVSVGTPSNRKGMMMLHPSDRMVKNRLLRALPAEDHARLVPHLKAVEIATGEMLFQPDTPYAHVYFFDSGVGSVVVHAPGGNTAEIGLYGVDGMAGIPVVLGTGQSPHQLEMQIGGTAWRMSAGTLRSAMDASPTLRDVLLRYVQVFLLQTAQTAVSNALHSVEERLARWLLMSHDRMDGDDVPLTHEFLALMLAVRRPTVTTSLHVLEGAGFIRATRGNIRMRDRAGLEELAGSAYGLPEAEYARLIGPLRRTATGQSAPAASEARPSLPTDDPFRSGRSEG